MSEGDKLQPCEDHISGGRNNLRFLSLARKLGFVVNRLLVVVDRQQGGMENLATEGVSVVTIFTGDILLEYGLAVNHITQDCFDLVQAYRQANQYGLSGLRQSSD